MNIPPDLDDPNAGHAPTPDVNADLNADFALKKKGSNTPYLIIGAVAVVGIGAFVYHGMQTQKTRELHASVMREFAATEKDDVVGEFWACLFGPGVDPGAFPNNLALGQRLDGAFAVDPKNFPTKVREECTPKAKDARHKIESIQAPAVYEPVFKEYEQSLDGLVTAFDNWAKVAPSHMAEKLVGQKVEADGNAWHQFQGGKPAAEVIAFDRFLHCAVPTVDKMKTGQEVVEFLFKQCKDAKYLEHLQEECGKEVTAEGVPQMPTSGFKGTVAKLQSDDRDLSAFDDCLRKSRKAKRSDDAGEVGKAWLAYMEAGRKVREAGKEALSEK